MRRHLGCEPFSTLLVAACGGNGGDGPDGSTADAAVPDSAMPDGSMTDSGIADAGIADGGTPDAGICAGSSDGTSCGPGMICVGGACAMARCGDGIRSGSEACDDGGDVSFDGCDVDCTFSCVSDADCDDRLPCRGTETCDLTTHRCRLGTPLNRDDGDACTDDVCDEAAGGCANPAIDGDGHASTSLDICGDDCDDSTPDIYTGAEELCDGVDNNCDGMADERSPTWYADCDGDGFGTTTMGSRTRCAAPAMATCGGGGGWTTTRPVDSLNTERQAAPGTTTVARRA